MARASLEELLLDFEDFLRHRRLAQWEPESPEAQQVRRVPQMFRDSHTDRSDPSDPTDLTDLTDQQRWALYAPWLEHADPAVRANAILCLINQANFLLDQQLATLEEQFIEQGGYSEQLAAARLVERDRRATGKAAPPDRIPACPVCGKPTVLRTAKSGKNTGQQFWGCSAYPGCKGVVNL